MYLRGIVARIFGPQDSAIFSGGGVAVVRRLATYALRDNACAAVTTTYRSFLVHRALRTDALIAAIHSSRLLTSAQTTSETDSCGPRPDVTSQKMSGDFVATDNRASCWSRRPRTRCCRAKSGKDAPIRWQAAMSSVCVFGVALSALIPRHGWVQRPGFTERPGDSAAVSWVA